jgi:predicted transcriptional regulator
MSNPRLKKHSNIVEKTIDADGNQEVNVTSDINCYTVITDKDRYVLIYEKFLSVLADVSHTDLKVFHAFCFKVDYMNSFQSSMRVMDEVAKELGLSSNTVRNSLTALKKSKFIHEHPKYKRTYIINPEFMWQGNTRFKQAVFKLILSKGLKEKNEQIVISNDKKSSLTKGSYTEKEIEGFFKED